MTVQDNVAYGLKMRNTPAAEIAARVQAVLEKVRLGGLAGRYPGRLSGGQQQRVALANSFVFCGIAVAMCLLIGVPMAWIMGRTKR